MNILQKNVKELGEDQLLEVQGKLAGIESQHRELERQGLNHKNEGEKLQEYSCLLYTSPSPRDQRGSRMPSSA